jgi:nitroreductase
MVDPVSEFFAKRRSIRDFRPDEVSPELIDHLLSDALLAPSWSNTRPYRVAVASGPVKEELQAELMQRWEAITALRFGSLAERLRALLGGRAVPRTDFRVPLTNPPDLQPRRVALAKKLFGHLGIARHDIAGREAALGRNYAFFGAPVVMFVFARSRMGVYSPLDAGFFAENLLLSAANRGLGACAQGLLAIWAAPVRRHFDIPRGYKLLFGISLGYPSDDPVNTFRPPETTVDEVTLRPRISAKMTEDHNEGKGQ